MVLSFRRAPLWQIKLTGRVLPQPPQFSGAMAAPRISDFQDFTPGSAVTAAELVAGQAWHLGIAPADVASAATGLLRLAPQHAQAACKPERRLPSQQRYCPAPEGLAMSDPTSPDLAEAINAQLAGSAWRFQG